MHAPVTLEAMRLGASCYTQKPLTRTIYEARLLAEVAKETGVCTQMGNQGTALDTRARRSPKFAPAFWEPKGGLRLVQPSSMRAGPNCRMTMSKFMEQANEEDPGAAKEVIQEKKEEIAKALSKWTGKPGSVLHPTENSGPVFITASSIAAGGISVLEPLVTWPVTN